jgi:hypothetical protein
MEQDTGQAHHYNEKKIAAWASCIKGGSATNCTEN